MGLLDGVLGAVLNSRGGGGQQDLMGNLIGVSSSRQAV